MKIGILKCDVVSEPFVAEHGQYPDMFSTLLKPVVSNLEIKLYDAENGELPKDIHEVDVFLITGSRYGVNDGFPWIEKLEAFVRKLYEENKKVIGICFGHQLIAKALGGKVIKSPKGWGVGVSQNKIVQQKSWMKPMKDRLNILVSHQDQVVELPVGAEVLASSDFCPYFIMQVGQHFLSIQGHPEFTKAYSKDLMISREDAVNEKELAQGLQSLDLPEDDNVFAEWMIHFCKEA